MALSFRYWNSIQNNGNSENKHFVFILAFDYILVIIRNHNHSKCLFSELPLLCIL